jgi:hypothetical protein
MRMGPFFAPFIVILPGRAHGDSLAQQSSVLAVKEAMFKILYISADN